MTADENWIMETQCTRELLHERPRIRPLNDFGLFSQKENSRRYRKNYLKSDSNSPCIFTVQCVCSNPTLTGVSVVRECKNVSKALSVLISRFRKLPGFATMKMSVIYTNQ